MNKKISFIVLCVILVAVILAAGMFYSNYSEEYTNEHGLDMTRAENEVQEQPNGGEEIQDEPENKSIAPDVEFFDINEKSHKLSQYFDKPVVFNFWATWCGPCKSEMPGFDNLYKKYKDKVHFIMLNVSDDRETVEEFMSENGYSFPIYFDDSGICSYTYGAQSIPMTFVLDEGGEIFGYQIGVLPEDALEGAIRTVLGEE